MLAKVTTNLKVFFISNNKRNTLKIVLNGWDWNNFMCGKKVEELIILGQHFKVSITPKKIIIFELNHKNIYCEICFLFEIDKKIILLTLICKNIFSKNHYFQKHDLKKYIPQLYSFLRVIPNNHSYSPDFEFLIFCLIPPHETVFISSKKYEKFFYQKRIDLF